MRVAVSVCCTYVATWSTTDPRIHASFLFRPIIPRGLVLWMPRPLKLLDDTCTLMQSSPSVLPRDNPRLRFLPAPSRLGILDVTTTTSFRATELHTRRLAVALMIIAIVAMAVVMAVPVPIAVPMPMAVTMTITMPMMMPPWWHSMPRKRARRRWRHEAAEREQDHALGRRGVAEDGIWIGAWGCRVVALLCC